MSIVLSRADVRVAWETGRLRYKLHEHQRLAYDRTRKQFAGKRKRRMAWRWSRRIGKTFSSQVIGVETCLRIKGARIVVAAPTGKHLEEFVHPAIRAICADAPPEFRPEWREKTSSYDFPNGSRICLYGCDTDAKIELMGRGGAAHGIIFEEAGAIPNLRYARVVVGPQLLSTRDMDDAGWMLYVGTPPISMAHEFVKVCRAYDADEGREIVYTIWDGHYDRDQVMAFIEDEADGIPLDEYMTTEAFRREFLAELIPDPVRKVLKFATEKWVKACQERYREVAAEKPPRFRRWYESMDVGWSPDWTFFLIGWWHFTRKLLVIEREVVYREGFRVLGVAKDIERVEKELLGESRRSRVLQKYERPSRWGDYSAVLYSELAADHNIVFANTRKDDRDTALHELDRMFPGTEKTGALAINPAGCPNLIQQVEACTWNKRRTDFAHDDVSRYGHYDGVASLLYMSRNVMRFEDPRPPEDADPRTHYIPEPDEQLRAPTRAERWARIFGLG